MKIFSFLFKISVYFLVFTALIQNLAAQNKDSSIIVQGDNPNFQQIPGIEYYFTFHPFEIEPSNPGIIKIYMLSLQNCKAYLTNEGLNFTKEYNLKANEVLTAELLPEECFPYYLDSTGNFSVLPEQVFSNTATKLRITGYNNTVISAVLEFKDRSEGLNVIRHDETGKVYTVSASGTNPNTEANGTSYTSIVGIYQYTKITFRLGGSETSKVQLQDGSILKYGGEIIRTLNVGDVWLIPGYQSNSVLTGSKITATKPIAVFSGFSTKNGEYLIEQEQPENTWGTKFIVPTIEGRKNYPIIHIFAKQPNTEILADGVPMWTITSPGGIIGSGYIVARAGIVSNPKPVVITTKDDLPINVILYNPGKDDDNMNSAPFKMQLTPVEQFKEYYVFKTPNSVDSPKFDSNFINITYKATPEGQIPDDFKIGRILNGKVEWEKLNHYSGHPGLEVLNDIPTEGRKYYSKTMKMNDSVYYFKSKMPFTVYSYGYTNGTGYGYQNSIIFADLEVPDTLAPYIEFEQDYCTGITSGLVFDEPRIDTEICSNLGLIYMDNSLSYNCTFEVKPFVIGNDISTTWSLKVRDKSLNAQAYLIFQDRAGNRKDTMVFYNAMSYEIDKINVDYGKFQYKLEPLTKTLSFSIKNMSNYLIDKSKYSIYLILDSDLEESKDSDIRTSQHFSLGDYYNANLTELAIGSEFSFKIAFDASTIGSFRDSIGIMILKNDTKDICSIVYFTELNAMVGTALFDSENHSFGDVEINKIISDVPVKISCPANSIFDLEISGYEYEGNIGSIGSNSVFEVDRLQLVSDKNKLVIPIGTDYEILVSFKPGEVKNYEASIHLITNADESEQSIALQGNGIPMVSVADVDKSSDLEIYPNPIFEDKFNIRLGQNQIISEINLYNYRGELIRNYNSAAIIYNSDNLSIPIYNLNNGLYFVEIKSGNLFIRKKLIVGC